MRDSYNFILSSQSITVNCLYIFISSYIIEAESRDAALSFLEMNTQRERECVWTGPADARDHNDRKTSILGTNQEELSSALMSVVTALQFSDQGCGSLPRVLSHEYSGD